MAREQRRDFFLQTKASAWDPALDKARMFWSPGGDGEDLEETFGELLRESPEFRQSLLEELRKRWWHIRNRNFNSVITLSDSIAFILNMRMLLLSAGVPVTDIVNFNRCLSRGCTCDGCDLVNGERIERIIREQQKEQPPRDCQVTGGVAEIGPSTLGGRHGKSAR